VPPQSPYSALSHLECSRCGARLDAGLVQGRCSCGGPLLARYDTDLIADLVSPAEIAGRPPDLWRYHELLPVSRQSHVVSLGEGMTSLLSLNRLGKALGVPELVMKDDGMLPTGTFKARGAAVGVSRAAELGVTGIAMPTNGNAGAAWAAYAARAGLRALIVMPTGAPEITRAECVAAGAELWLVDGHIGAAGRLVAAELPRRPGFQDASTLGEPYRLDGKKTIGYEIAEQLGWRPPDVIVCPVGGGVAIIGIYLALLQLRELGWIGGDLPRLVAVQASGCAPIVRAFEAGARQSAPWPDARTVAFGITVPKALGDFLVLDALYATGGTALAVDDDALLADQREVARLEGCFICPEGAACVTAVRRLRESGWLAPGDQVVVLNTGSGLKYPGTVPVRAGHDVPLRAPTAPIDGPRGLEQLHVEITAAAAVISTPIGVQHRTARAAMFPDGAAAASAPRTAATPMSAGPGDPRRRTRRSAAPGHRPDASPPSRHRRSARRAERPGPPSAL
jgi:threonine synthase